jgi:capsular polysaccharide biosynthesis protein
MTESFDAFRYISYMRSRWLWIACSAGVASILALIISLLLPNRYTAAARLVIEPPAGTDLRAAMAVSPIYLESLKTYEQFASSDSVFEKAVERFGLGGAPVETLKRRVLKVQIIRNTRILEIAVTLPDPKKAQAMARFLADAAVELNRSSVAESDEELLRGFAVQERDARDRFNQAETLWAHAVTAEPTESLRAAIEQSADARAKLDEQVQSVQLQIADVTERLKQTPPPEQQELRKEESNAQARLAEMRKQVQEFDRQNAERERLLATRQAHRDLADANRRTAQTEFSAVEARLRDARGETGYRGERLKIIDPGIVPQRPSSPNLPLNIAAALLAGVVLPILYLTLDMSYQEHRAASRRSALRAG